MEDYISKLLILVSFSFFNLFLQPQTRSPFSLKGYDEGDLKFMHQSVGYVAWFGPGNMSSSLKREKWIDICTIMSLSNRMERNMIFGEGEVLDFFWHVWLYLLDNMDKLQMI